MKTLPRPQRKAYPMLDSETAHRVIDGTIDSMGNSPDGWVPPGIGVNIQFTAGRVEPLLMVMGRRTKDGEAGTFWRVEKWLEPKLCGSIKYIEAQIQNAYLSLMTFASCECQPGGTKWLPDEDGDFVRPMFITKYCDEHQRMYGTDPE